MEQSHLELMKKRWTFSYRFFFVMILGQKVQFIWRQKMFGNDTVMGKRVGINIEMDDVITGF